MSSSSSITFSKSNLDGLLNEVGKEFRKRNGSHAAAEIILIGGAAILACYDFREMTHDVDAIIRANSSMKEAINFVGDKHNLPNFWLNADFLQTNSYSATIIEISKYYRTFSNVLQVRVVHAEFLIAMKLCAGREYKHDLSDVVGILHEHTMMNKPITFEMISEAILKLYGSWDFISKDSFSFLQNIFKSGDYEKEYLAVKEFESNNRRTLKEFKDKNPEALTKNNTSELLKQLNKMAVK